MNGAATGIVVLGAINIFCSVLSHMVQKKYWLAVAAATIFSVVLFQVVSFLQQGYIDPFVVIAIITTSLISAAGAIVIGLIFKVLRKARDS
jgi:hypothetical protein